MSIAPLAPRDLFQTTVLTRYRLAAAAAATAVTGEQRTQVYLFQFLNVFVPIAKCICPNLEIYFPNDRSHPDIVLLLLQLSEEDKEQTFKK